MPLICNKSTFQTVEVNDCILEDVVYLPLTVAAPGIDVSSGGKGEHMFTAHGDVFYEQPLQGRHQLGAGFIPHHRVRQTDQTL